jgi:hypothetical protein
MAKKPKVLARDQYEIIGATLDIPDSFVRQVIIRLKSDRRIEATRPVTTPMTPCSLARIVIGLAAPTPSRATEIERRIGALPRLSGDGEDTVEAELTAIITEAAGTGDGDIDFRTGDILISPTAPFAAISLKKFGVDPVERVYRFGESAGPKRMTTIVQFPLSTVRKLARELIH